MQNNISNNTNISFKSNIRFISNREYKNLLNRIPGVYAREMSDLKYAELIKDNGLTDGIKFCVAGVLNNLTKGEDFIFHWFPNCMFRGIFNQYKLPNLIEITDKLKEVKKSDELKGFLIGGLSKSIKKDKNKISLRLLNALKRPFKLQERTKFTMFFSQNFNKLNGKYPESAFAYSKSKDTYYVNAGSYAGFDEQRFADLLDKDEIRDHFDFIHVADDDKVFIGSDSQERIPNEFWKKNTFAEQSK